MTVEAEVTVPRQRSEREQRRRAKADRKRAARDALYSAPLHTFRDRVFAWGNMLFVDHGLVRLFHANRHRVDDALWRSAQPSPFDIRWADRTGIRTIVYLRGGTGIGSWALERAACARRGLALVTLPLSSRHPPSRETIRAAAKVFDEIAYPALVHCKAGADRAGLAGALYLLLKRRATAAEAERQLGWRYGHWRSAKTGVLDAFIEAYRTEGEAEGLGFLEWVETRYDRERVARDFKPRPLTGFLVDRILRRE